MISQFWMPPPGTHPIPRRTCVYNIGVKMEATDPGYLAIRVSLVPGTHSSRFQLFSTCDSLNAKVYR